MLIHSKEMLMAGETAFPASYRFRANSNYAMDIISLENPTGQPGVAVSSEGASLKYTLDNIEGVLGSPNSRVSSAQGFAVGLYTYTKPVFDLPFYWYKGNAIMGDGTYFILVSPKQRIGDTVLYLPYDGAVVLDEGTQYRVPDRPGSPYGITCGKTPIKDTAYIYRG